MKVTPIIKEAIHKWKKIYGIDISSSERDALVNLILCTGLIKDWEDVDDKDYQNRLPKKDFP